MSHAWLIGRDFWRKWRHGVAVAVWLIVAYYVLTWLHAVAVGAYKGATGVEAGGLVSVAVAALLVGAYLLIAPVVISQFVRDIESPATHDQIQALIERCRYLEERHERSLDHLAEAAGLDWQGAFGRMRILVRQGRESEAVELYRQESGAAEAEAVAVIREWDASAADIKLRLLIRYLERLSGRGRTESTGGPPAEPITAPATGRE